MICMVHGGTIKFLNVLLECFMEPAKPVFDLRGRISVVRVEICSGSSAVQIIVPP